MAVKKSENINQQENIKDNMNVISEEAENKIIDDEIQWEDEEEEPIDNEEDILNEMNENMVEGSLTTNEKSEPPTSEINWNSIIPAKSKPKTISAFNGKKGVVTLVNGNKCGLRVVLSKDLYNQIKLEGTVQIGFLKDAILMGKQIPGQTVDFKLKIQGAKYIIYSASLVKEIIKKLELVFGEENKTSITFYNVTYDESLETPVAVIRR